MILGDFNTLSKQKAVEIRRLMESRGYSTPLPIGTATWRGAGLRFHADWIFVHDLRVKRWGVRSRHATAQSSDVIITMGCGDACPVFPGKRYEDWKLDDPAGLGVEAVRPIRDEIGRRVRSLVDELLGGQ